MLLLVPRWGSVCGPTDYWKVCPQMPSVFNCDVACYGNTFVNCSFVEPKPVAEEVDRGIGGDFIVEVRDEVCISMYRQ
jgi:hypothetical protein